MAPLKLLKLSSRVLLILFTAKLLHDLVQRFFFAGEELTLWTELGWMFAAIGLDATHRILAGETKATRL
jgi:hypothetical protein